MAEQILEKLFESVPKVRLLRLFMRNPDVYFSFPEIYKRSQVKPRAAKKELAKLLKIGIAKTKIGYIREEIRRKSRSKKTPKVIIKTKKARVYYADSRFELLDELRALVTKSAVASRQKLIKQIRGLGKMKLAIISGAFLNSDNSRTDLLIVGDHIKKKKLDNFLAEIESELGKSLRYTSMDTKEFKYRLDMYDRFLRDILEYPHKKLINTLRI